MSTTGVTPAGPVKLEVAARGVEDQIKLGEGVMWDSTTKKVYHVDILGQKLFVYDPATSTNRTIPLPSLPGTVVSTTDPNVVVVPMHNGIHYVSLVTGQCYHTGIDPEKHLPSNRYNDGKCDPRGRLVVGSMHLDSRTPRTAFLYRIDSDGTVTTLLSDITVSNGLEWSKDRTKFWYIDTPANQVMEFDYDDDSGSISHGRPVLTVSGEDGLLDGMTVDSNDNLWIALWNGNRVIQYDPRSQMELFSLPIPSRYVTSVCFGGEDLTDLYVCSASEGEGWPADAQLEPDAGSLFVVRNIGVKGVPTTPFAGAIPEHVK